MGLTLNQGEAPPQEADTFPSNTPEEKKFLALREGVYPCEVMRCELRDAPSWVDYAKEVSFGLRVTEGEYKGRWIWAQCEARLDESPDCTLRLWLQVLSNLNPLPDGFEFIESDYIGLDCKAQVSTYWSKKYQEDRNSVEDLLPARDFGGNADSAREAF